MSKLVPGRTASRTIENLAKMEYRILGATNLQLSRLGFGAMGNGSPPWRKWVLDESAGRSIVQRALEVGVNFIDTCDYYSNGESEIAIGRLIKNLVKREELVLATKAGNP